MTDATADLDDLREDIDAQDAAIADLIAERVTIAEDVAREKAAADRELVDESREATVADNYAAHFRERGLSAEHGEALAELLIEISLERERDVEDGAED